MFNPHIKFEMSTVTCNEEMKGNSKCENFRFEPPFVDLGVTYMVHLWLAGQHVVDFLLAIIEFFRQLSRLRHYEAKSVEIGGFRRGLVTLSANFRQMGTSPAIRMDRQIEERCSYNLAAGSFHTTKLCSRRFSTEVEIYWKKQQNCVLCHPLGDLRVTYTVHLWLVGKRVVDFLLALIELFSLAVMVEAL